MRRLLKFSIYIVIILSFVVIQNVKACADCSEEQFIVSKANTSSLLYQSEERYPQTKIYEVVTNFLENSKSAAEENRKVLVLGYDGFREDALYNIMEYGAVKEVSEQGGLYHSYAGANGEQETSTAPGWLSILSGQWSHEFDVINNDGEKPEDVDTFLNKAVENGYASTFLASWAPHFDTTYREDMEDENGIDYIQTSSDEESVSTLQSMLRDETEMVQDVIFAAFEYTDHAGHTDGYGNNIQAYVDSSRQVVQIAHELIQTVYSRTTYEKEDWLIILTSDHGGIGSGHGGQSEEERNTWFAMNKKL